jgi:beta-lactamase class A
VIRTPAPSCLFGRMAPGLAVLALAACSAESPEHAATPGSDASAGAELRGRVEGLMAESGAEVALYYRPLDGTDSLLIEPDLRMHAASTMKVPVMIQLYLDRDAGLLSLDDPIPVDPVFQSIVDGSEFSMQIDSDSEGELYGRLGEDVSIRELNELMITVSSNFATNLLIKRVDARRVTATMRSLGADSIQVLRGVEDLKAFEAGLSNSTTARDLGIIMTALGNGEAGSPGATDEMLETLKRQKFREKIPAGLPQGTVVAHKTGNITRISHDAAVVYPPEGRPYVLVVMIRGLDSDDESASLAASLSRAVWEYHTGG